MNVKRKYSGLGFLALLFKIVAWIALIASIAFAVWFWFQDYSVRILDFATFSMPKWLGATVLPFGIFTFIQFYVLGALIELLIDVEYNTRANATVTSELIKAVEALRVREAAQPSSPAVISPTPPPPPPPPPTETLEPAPVAPPIQETQPVASIEESAPPPPPPGPEPEPAPEPEPEPAAEADEPPTEESAS